MSKTRHILPAMSLRICSKAVDTIMNTSKIFIAGESSESLTKCEVGFYCSLGGTPMKHLALAILAVSLLGFCAVPSAHAYFTPVVPARIRS